MSNPERADSANERVQDLEIVEDALARGVRDALRHHKAAGNPVPEWRNGQVQWLSPEEIPDLTVAARRPESCASDSD